MLNNKKLEYLIFDLDGTLIDSRKSVIESLKYAFNRTKLKILIDEDKFKIGPPLEETILMWNNLLSNDELHQIKLLFKEYYDSNGFKNIRVFNNIENFIQMLHKEKIPLYIATNKRYVPTKKIISYLKWDKYFKEIYCIDRFKLNKTNKKSMLNFLIRRENINGDECLYCGDRYDDYIAANANKMKFLGANWGESDFEKFECDFKIIYDLNYSSINFFIGIFK